MVYLFADISISPFSEEAVDCLSALLGEVGFDTFEPTEQGVKAYIPKESFSRESIDQVIDDFFFPVEISYEMGELENKDYNEEWEREHFDPVLEREFGIKLDPRMAFGSGNHETTHQLVSLIMKMDFHGQRVLDMGCGTGVLGIAMAKRGADFVKAIDIDDLSVANTQLNFSLNGLSQYEAVTGDASAIDGMYDTIIANIFKSILIRDMGIYVSHLQQGGTIVFSGFYTSDINDMVEAATGNGLTLVSQQSDNDWAVLVFRK